MGLPDRPRGRILIVTTVEVTVRSFLLPLARLLQDEGWEVHAMASGITDTPAPYADLDGIWEAPWSRRATDPRNPLLGPAEVRRMVRRLDIDVVHVHTPVAAFVTRFALRRMRRKGQVRVIYTVHGLHHSPHEPVLRRWVFLWLERVASRWTDELVVMNTEDRDLAMKHHFLPPDRIHLTRGMGIDSGQWAPGDDGPARAALRAELGVAPDHVLLLMVAEFIPRKRHADLVAALARLDRHDVHAVFVGASGARPPRRRTAHEEIRALAEAYGVGNRVHILGLRSDVRDLMRAADATVLTSRREGLPMAVLESLSLGVPVIGADVKGTRDLLAGGGGLLYPMGDVDALADRIRILCDDPGLRERLSAAARATATTHDQASTLPTHLAIIERCAP